MRASPDDQALDPEAARVLSKVRRLMAISVAFTGLAVAAVLVVVGYRMMTGGGTAAGAVAQAEVKLPPGARVTATAVSGERIAVTIEAEGATEIRVFDLETLRPRGRLRLAPGR